MDKVWFVTMHTGYCGSDGHDILVMPAAATDDEVQEEAYRMAVDNAAMYGYYPPSEFEFEFEFDCEAEDEDQEDESISENIEGYAVPYDAKKHDKYRAGGGSFMNDPVYKQADL